MSARDAGDAGHGDEPLGEGNTHPLLARAVAEMRRIPGGTFTMGSDAGSEWARPARLVIVSGFRMGAHPATVGMWREYCRATGTSMPDPPEGGWVDDHPMVHVSWNDVLGTDGRGGYCAWASAVTGVRLTLPTEAQWEYCAREGGKPIEFPWGETFDPERCWSSVETPRPGTAPVGRTEAVHRNALGLTDLAGNVWEWCVDGYAAYPTVGLLARWFGRAAPERDPTGPEGRSHRVLRGGSWINGNPDLFRCADRDGGRPDDRNDDSGFRLAAPEY